MEKTTIEKTAMKNITTIKKTTIAKITANITTTALLLFLLLFALTTCLKAQVVQENSKPGFFAGFVYLQGFQVDSSKSISESTATTSYEVTGTSDTTRIKVNEVSTSLSAEAQTGIKDLVSANCEIGVAQIDSNYRRYSIVIEDFFSFDSGRKPTLTQIANGDATVTTVDPNGTAFRTGFVNDYISHCYRYFYGDLSSDRTPFVFPEYSVSADSSVQVAASSSTESDKLSGIGLQFGYRGEKWRASFTHYQGSGGDNELTNSLIIADYFFQEKFFVGAGLASIKLTNSSAGNSTSVSTTSPVLQVGYSEKLASNLQLSIGVLQYSSGVSLSSTTAPTITITSFSETQTAIGDGDSATIGINRLVIPPGQLLELKYGSGTDSRVEATQVGERTVNIQKTVTPAGGATTIEAELKAPTVIGISLHFSF